MNYLLMNGKLYVLVYSSLKVLPGWCFSKLKPFRVLGCLFPSRLTRVLVVLVCLVVISQLLSYGIAVHSRPLERLSLPSLLIQVIDLVVVRIG